MIIYLIKQTTSLDKTPPSSSNLLICTWD